MIKSLKQRYCSSADTEKCCVDRDQCPAVCGLHRGLSSVDKGVSIAERMTQVHKGNHRTENEDPCKTHPPGNTEDSSVKKHEVSESKPRLRREILREVAKSPLYR